ncbi:AAA family ATPase [Deinococcus peraridilitoris]|uniref:ATPase involved in DNA repair n=1 Tax=Deinococcus peraridilitoris (strain DSM 19664 / LMG 22246 / CIP 109416 / KR-200) TaxID=937777 RepID=L0A4Y3_DEIPD|nr:SMC family ATPase [Deinococcus peraridilitoris]AFZ68921.1 ATPase involved in DNA repair [Deinococcus peraridilitoris DSM 19664]
MKPLKLAVQGFTCFRQHVEIDFEHLELYAIQGPTGSGKSSLLDAVMYALYGQTPRLGKIGHDALISQGERGLSISLEFESAGARYRVARARGRRQADNEVRFETWNGERFVTLTETKKAETQLAIEKVVGLNFDSFTRAVVLPQGQFDRFLRGTGKERQELLGALLDLDHYRRMAEVAGERKAALSADLRAQQTLLDGEYASLTPEVLDGWRTEVRLAEEAAEQGQSVREQLSARVAELAQIGALHAQLRAARASLSELEERRAATNEALERARRARRVAGVLPRIEARDRAQSRAERAMAEVSAARQTRDERVVGVRAALQQSQEAQSALQECPALQRRADGLHEAERKLAVLRRHGGSLGLTDPSPRAWDEDAFVQARERVNFQQQLSVEAKAIEHEAREIAALRLRVASDDENLAAWRLQQEDVTEKGRQIRSEHDVAAAELRSVREREGALALRHQLHVGQPCPLCEQTVHALPAPPAVDMATLEQRTLTLEEALLALRDRLSELRANIRALEGTVTRDRSDLYRREEALNSRREALRRLQEQLSGDAAAEARSLLAGLAAELRASGDDPAGQRRALLSEIAMRVSRTEEIRRRAATLEVSLAAAEAALSSAERGMAERQSEFDSAEQVLSTSLAELRLTEAQASSAALPEHEILGLEERYRLWSTVLEKCQGEVADLESTLGGRTFDERELLEARAQCERAEQYVTASRRRAAELAAQLRAGEEKLARKLELEAALARTSRDLDTWSALAQSLRANEFQQFLLAEVESSLLDRAGELLFEISDGRYRLLLESGEYSVQDLWNAGETRGVKTLSGGETFLASLALAIALSDYLAGNHILGALFLDEGFGTLDPQALEAVAGALEKVRTQGRTVGVITHVESLSERLPSRILVSKSVAGSRALRME